MLYEALCLDNRNYFETGTITVRIFEYYNAPRRIFDKNKGKVTNTNVDDLSKRPEMLTEGNKSSLDETTKGRSGDFEALVYAPLGGGRNYGMFALPQINEKGLITFLDGAFSKPIWMGSYFSAIRDPEDFNKIKAVNIPNEDPDKEGIDSDGSIDGAANNDLDPTTLKGDQRTIVLRTKKTTYDENDKTKMDFESTTNTSTENLIAIDDKKVRVRHFTQWDDDTVEKYQEVLIYKDMDNSNKETIKLEVNNIADDKRGVLTLTEDGFLISVTDGEDTSTFELTASGDGINFSDKHGNIIIGNEDGIQITTDDNNTILANGDADSIVLFTDLKDILDQLMEHIHIGSVPTAGPLNSNKAPVVYTKQMNDMEANMVKSRHK